MLSRICVLMIITIASSCLPAFAAVRPLSVLDFGAKGDGTTDDTQAIVAAVAAVRKGFKNFHRYPGAVGHVSVPELVFPAGMYLISRPISLGHYARIRGEGDCVIRQTKADQNIFDTGGYRLQMGGIRFEGGRSAIAIATENLDTSHTIIEKCQFYGTSGAAIQVEDNSPSTLLKISDCVFLACEQVLINRCDDCILADSWITTSRGMKNKAAIENHDVLICQNIIGVPLGEAGDDTVIVRRMEGSWPHVQVRNVRIDLGKFPYFCWRNRDNGLDPAGYAIRVVHNASRKAVLLTEQHWEPFFDYNARDLRTAIELDGGVHSFDIKFYFLGINFRSSTERTRAKKGDALVIDFLRFEAE